MMTLEWHWCHVMKEAVSNWRVDS